MTKPHGVSLVDQKKPTSIITKNKKKATVKHKTLPKNNSAQPKPVLEAEDVQVNASVLPTTVNLSANKLAKLLGRFMDLRSTIRGMGNSVKQVEEWLDSAYDMFEIA